jgi:hypothetical protein
MRGIGWGGKAPVGEEWFHRCPPAFRVGVQKVLVSDAGEDDEPRRPRKGVVHPAPLGEGRARVAFPLEH